MQDSSYQEIVKAYREIEKPEQELKFKELLSKDSLFKPITELKPEEVQLVLTRIKNPQHKIIQRYLGLAVDIAFNVAVIVGPQKAGPLIKIVKLLVESKVDPNGKTHLGIGQADFLQESLSARQDFAMTKIFIDAGAKKPSDFSLLSMALLNRDPACALHAWHFFKSGSSLWEKLKWNDSERYCVTHAVQKFIEKKDFNLYVFFKTLDLFFRDQRFFHIKAALFELLPDVLIKMVGDYLGTREIVPAQVEEMISKAMNSEAKVSPTLNEEDLLFDSIMRKTPEEKQSLSKALLVPQVLQDPTQEMKAGDFFVLPLMLAVGLGDHKGVKSLLKAKAEPLIFSGSGHSCLIWALNAVGEQQATIVEELMLGIDGNAPKADDGILNSIRKKFN